MTLHGQTVSNAPRASSRGLGPLHRQNERSIPIGLLDLHPDQRFHSPMCHWRSHRHTNL